MQIIDKLYKDAKPLYPVERFCPTDRLLFIDIETTGLKKETTSLYLIGCGHYCKDGFFTRLFFADSESEEAEILLSFSGYLRSFTHIMHFNGDKFDVPYLLYKASLYDIKDLFAGITGLDIYKMCKPLRYMLFPDSMRQKSIEGFLGVARDDRYNGGELIEVYKNYVRSNSPDDLELLITHNREDVLGMHLIMSILYYLDLKDAALTFVTYTVKSYVDYEGNVCEEVIFDYTFDLSLPVSFTAKTNTMYVKVNVKDKKISIRLPIITDELKIYFENYKEYFYLPGEDIAILRSVASALPKDRYQKATKQNCYQKYAGKFVKQPSAVFTPVFKSDIKDKKMYFRFPEDFKKEAAEEFGRRLLNIFFLMKRRT